MYIDLSKIKSNNDSRLASSAYNSHIGVIKVALVHDFLIRPGGAEKVLKKLTKLYPEAPIYTLFYNKSFVKENFAHCKIHASFLQPWYQFLLKVTFGSMSQNIHRILAPLMPLAAETLDLSKFAAIISSTSYAAKGIICPENTTHLSYIHTPTRWLWQDKEINARLKQDERKMKFKSGEHLPSSATSPNKKQEIRNKSLATCYLLLLLHYLSPLTYLRLIKRTIAKIFIHLVRIWDYEAAQRPDVLIANSAYTAQRIKKYYGRDAKVVYPPAVAEINARLKQDERKMKFKSGEHLPSSATSPNKKQEIRNKKYFITISRLSRYKKIDVAIRAFNDLGYNLLVIGEGPELKRLQKIAGSNIYFAGFIEDEELFKKTIKKAAALVHPAREDFGMVMAEALSLEVPVIAPNCGGAREIVKPGINGELYEIRSTQDKKQGAEINARLKQGERKMKFKSGERLPSSATSNNARIEIQALKSTIKKFIQHYPSLDPVRIKKSANRFTEKGFAKSIKEIINAR